MSTEHRTLQISGSVQGVFYRQSTQAEARRLGLAGYARNNPDGTVTVEAEGPPEALAALEAWCRQGPPGAQVAGVAVAEGAVRGLVGFEIRG